MGITNVPRCTELIKSLVPGWIQDNDTLPASASKNIQSNWNNGCIYFTRSGVDGVFVQQGYLKYLNGSCRELLIIHADDEGILVKVEFDVYEKYVPLSNIVKNTPDWYSYSALLNTLDLDTSCLDKGYVEWFTEELKKSYSK